MNYLLVYPMAAMVLMTSMVLFATFRRRVRAVRAGEADAGYYKTYQEGTEPRDVAQFSRHFVNMFEAPTLFYAACIVAMLIGESGLAIVVLAWSYVALRAAHALVHTGSNKLLPRMRVYMVSWVVLLAMWTLLVVAVATQR